VEFSAKVQLLDGRDVSLRRISADDADALLTLHQHLCDRDRYLRFFTLRPARLDQLVSELIEPASGQYALGAFDGDRLIGVANYVVSDDPSVAELAMLVAHEDHLQGTGTALLKHLSQIARNHGIRYFVADIMAENHLMFEVLSDLGWPRRRLAKGMVVRVQVELPDHHNEA
jgi:GNAT superfamily N-acetyltransferase